MLFSPDEATLFLGIWYQQFRELASPVPVDCCPTKEPNDPFKRKCQDQVPDSHGYPSALLSQQHMEKYYPISVSVEARGKTFPRWQRKQSAQCSLQMAALHPAPTQRPVQKWRSELLLYWERGPWEEDGNITPTLCLLYLNDSLRDVSLPTLVKAPDPLILLFFSCQKDRVLCHHTHAHSSWLFHL